MGYLSYCSYETLPGVGELFNFPTQWKGVNVLTTTDPKFCPVCENGVKNQLRLKRLRKEYTDDGSFKMLMVHSEIQHLEKKMQEHATHRKSIEVQEGIQEGSGATVSRRQDHVCGDHRFRVFLRQGWFEGTRLGVCGVQPYWDFIRPLHQLGRHCWV